MNALIKTGRIIVAIGLTGLSALCLRMEDFIVGRPPAWPENFNLNPLLAYAGAAILLLGSIGILTKKAGGVSALTIALLILSLSISRHVPQFIDWINSFKAIALFGGLLVIAHSFFRDDSSVTSAIRINAPTRKTLLWIGCIALSSFFIASGVAHFKFEEFISKFLMPSYFPFRPFWTYFTAICLFAGAIGLLIPPIRKWAALLSGIMVFAWFILVHTPRVISIGDNGELLGLFESFTIAGIVFVLAGISKGND